MDVLVIGGNRFVGWPRLPAPRGGPQGHPSSTAAAADPFGGRVDRIVADRTRAISIALQGRRFDAVVDSPRSPATTAVARSSCSPDAGMSWSRPARSTSCARVLPAPAREEDYDGLVMARPSDAADVRLGRLVSASAPARTRRRGARRAASATRVRIPIERRARLPAGWSRTRGGSWTVALLLPGGASTASATCTAARSRASSPRSSAVPRRSERPTTSRRRRRRRSTSSWRSCAATSAAGADVLPITTEEVMPRVSTPYGYRRSAGGGCRSSIRPARAPSSAFATSRSRSTSERSWQASSPTRRRIGRRATHDATSSALAAPGVGPTA